MKWRTRSHGCLLKVRDPADITSSHVVHTNSLLYHSHAEGDVCFSLHLWTASVRKSGGGLGRPDATYVSAILHDSLVLSSMVQSEEDLS